MNDILPVNLRRHWGNKLRRPFAVFHSCAAGALLLVWTLALAACTVPAYDDRIVSLTHDVQATINSKFEEQSALAEYTKYIRTPAEADRVSKARSYAANIGFYADAIGKVVTIKSALEASEGNAVTQNESITQPLDSVLLALSHLQEEHMQQGFLNKSDIPVRRMIINDSLSIVNRYEDVLKPKGK